jgi:hypothetical protein
MEAHVLAKTSVNLHPRGLLLLGATCDNLAMLGATCDNLATARCHQRQPGNCTVPPATTWQLLGATCDNLATTQTCLTTEFLFGPLKEVKRL